MLRFAPIGHFDSPSYHLFISISRSRAYIFKLSCCSLCFRFWKFYLSFHLTDEKKVLRPHSIARCTNFGQKQRVMCTESIEQVFENGCFCLFTILALSRPVCLARSHSALIFFLLASILPFSGRVEPCERLHLISFSQSLRQQKTGIY